MCGYTAVPEDERTCLLACLFLCVCTVTISPARIKLAASDFARRFIGVLGRESPILAELCSSRSPKSDESASHREVKFRA